MYFKIVESRYDFRNYSINCDIVLVYKHKDFVQSSCVTTRAIVSYINDYIPITEKEYIEILHKFNVKFINNQPYFDNKKDAQKTVDYLNEKYAVVINLMGN